MERLQRSRVSEGRTVRKKKGREASLEGLAEHPGRGCQNGRGGRLRRLWGECSWGTFLPGAGRQF